MSTFLLISSPSTLDFLFIIKPQLLNYIYYRYLLSKTNVGDPLFHLIAIPPTLNIFYFKQYFESEVICRNIVVKYM